MQKNQRASPGDEPRISCSNVDPYFPEQTAPHLFPQSELNDLVREFKLSKIQAELLASRLQGWNLLQKGVNVSKSKRLQSLSTFLFYERRISLL
jgi:hypothetical protein